ncbi:hypothetical protein GYY_09270 [Methanococcus maripaludis X1]|uniref:Uncharacterized protein n=1 Tax=Methanococcus maripaludis X1 TaxID=1053692 RepID=G0H3W4_METMI|nr:hypothetical protein GYY_09270 [Methanococcus maripaludis X1]
MQYNIQDQIPEDLELDASILNELSKYALDISNTTIVAIENPIIGIMLFILNVFNVISESTYVLIVHIKTKTR